MLQSKLKIIKTVTSESFEFLKKKPNKMNCAKCVSGVFTLIGCKLTIKDESEMNWHKLPESSIRELNEANHTEYISNMTTLMKCKLAI